MYHKNIPRDGRLRVRPDLRAQALRDLLSLPVEGGYVWRAIGPAQGLPAGASEIAPGPLVGGLVSDVAVGRTPDRIAIGTRAGGVWRTDDGGATWRACGDGLPSLQTVTVAMVDPPAGEPILLAGTGDLNNEQIRNTGLIGLYRSVDGGRTWSVADGGADATRFRSHDANQIWALDADRILLATRVGLYYSRDGGRNFGADAQHRDGRPMLRGPVQALSVQGSEVTATVGGEPTSRPEQFPPEIVAQQQDPAAEQGLWRAQLAGAALGAFTLVHPTRALVADDTVGDTTFDRQAGFFLVSAARREIPLDTIAEVMAARAALPHHSVQFTRADPATLSEWHVLPSRPAKPEQSHYVHTLALEPLRTGRAAPDAWFGTVPLMRGEIRLQPAAPPARPRARFVWSPVENGTPFTVHVDQHALQVVPTGPSTVRTLVGNDGGFYRTDDAGATWQSFNQHGAIMFWTLAAARKDATTLRLVGGLQDNDTVVGEGPLDPAAPTQWTWQRIASLADGGAVAFLPQDRTHFLADDPRAAFMTASGRLCRATGTTVGGWTQTGEFEATPRPFPFSEAIAVARGPAGEWDRHYFAASEFRYGPGRIWRRDGAGTFEEKHQFPSMVTAVVAAPADPATERAAPPGEWRDLWVGLADGQVFYSDDAGDTFTLQAVGNLANPVTGIAVDPTDSRRVAVVYGGFSDRGRSQSSARVFLTENKSTFRDISGARGPNGFVPDLPMLAVAFTRTLPSALIVSTDLGVLVTSGPTLGQRWSRLGVGLPTTICTGLGVVNTTPADPLPPLSDGLPPVAVATFGRGAYLLARPAAATPVIELDGGFGAVRVGATARRTLTVRNPGGAPLTITAAAAPAPFSFDGLPALPLTIPAGGSSAWQVVCRPTAAGAQAQDLSLTIGGAQTVPVSCEAVTDGPPRLALWPRAVNFGPLGDGTSLDETIHLQNTGLSDLHLTAITADAGGSARLALTPAVPPALTLAPGEERAFTLRFQAQGVGTTHRAAWAITCDDPIADPEHFKVSAEGEVTAPAAQGGGGVPTWVWFAVAGGALVAGVIIGVVVADALDDD